LVVKVLIGDVAKEGDPGDSFSGAASCWLKLISKITVASTILSFDA